MSPEEYRAVAYRLGHDFARKQLRAGKAPDSVRLAMDRAQERLLALRAYSATLAEMKRLGVEDALAGKPMDRRYAGWGVVWTRRALEYALELLSKIAARWGYVRK